MFKNKYLYKNKLVTMEIKDEKLLKILRGLAELRDENEARGLVEKYDERQSKLITELRSYEKTLTQEEKENNELDNYYDELMTYIKNNKN